MIEVQIHIIITYFTISWMTSSHIAVRLYTFCDLDLNDCLKVICKKKVGDDKFIVHDP